MREPVIYDDHEADAWVQKLRSASLHGRVDDVMVERSEYISEQIKLLSEADDDKHDGSTDSGTTDDRGDSPEVLEDSRGAGIGGDA